MNKEFLTQKSCNSYVEVADKFREDMKAGKLEKRHTAKRHGYVRKLEYIANVYMGRYGVGYTLSSNCEEDPKYYMVTYYIYKDKLYGYEVAISEKYKLYMESKAEKKTRGCVKYMRCCVKYCKLYVEELKDRVDKEEDKEIKQSLEVDLIDASQRLRGFMDMLREEVKASEKHKIKQ